MTSPPPPPPTKERPGRRPSLLGNIVIFAMFAACVIGIGVGAYHATRYGMQESGKP